MGKLKGRTNFVRVWLKASKKVHLDLLSKPAERRLVPYPNPKYYRQVPIRIEKATLKHQPSKRLKMLSQVPQGRFTEKYAPAPKPEHFVQEYNLSYVPSQRIEELSKPRVSVKKGSGKPTRKSSRKSATAAEKKKKVSVELTEKRNKWLKMRAVPKKYPPETSEMRKKRERREKREREGLPPEDIPIKTLLAKDYMEERMGELSKPNPKYVEVREKMMKPWDPFKVPKRALKAILTPRIKELSQPPTLNEEVMKDLTYNPFVVKRAALRAVLPPRIDEIAVPRHVTPKAGKREEKRDPAFDVPRRALKAKCNKRTMELAKPVKRKGADDKIQDPFVVPRIALVAICPERVKTLAVPRYRREKYKKPN